jgi:hypothetical protein
LPTLTTARGKGGVDRQQEARIIKLAAGFRFKNRAHVLQYRAIKENMPSSVATLTKITVFRVRTTRTFAHPTKATQREGKKKPILSFVPFENKNG